MDLIDKLLDWPKYFIQDTNLFTLIGKSANSCYSIVKRAVKSGTLIRIKRGLYLIKHKLKHTKVDKFELSQYIYGLSYVSLESALSYHGLIPEVVYTTSCVTIKRSKEFETPLGSFSYSHTPVDNFLFGVERCQVGDSCFFIATPWKSIADHIYVKKRYWKSFDDFVEDMRIEESELEKSDFELLRQLSKGYPSARVRKQLNIFVKDLKNEI